MWMLANVATPQMCGEKPRYGCSFKFHTLQQQQKPVWILLDSFYFIFSRHDFFYCPVRQKPKVRWGDAGRTRNRRNLALSIPSCRPFLLRLSIQLSSTHFPKSLCGTTQFSRLGASRSTHIPNEILGNTRLRQSCLWVLSEWRCSPCQLQRRRRWQACLRVWAWRRAQALLTWQGMPTSLGRWWWRGGVAVGWWNNKMEAPSPSKQLTRRDPEVPRTVGTPNLRCWAWRFTATKLRSPAPSSFAKEAPRSGLL